MEHVKGKWKKIRGHFLSEDAYGTCSICEKRSKLIVEPYYLSLDVIGLDKCPNCGSDMEFFFS